MPRMKPRSVQTAKGSRKVMKVTITPGQRAGRERVLLVRQAVAGEHDVERDDEPGLPAASGSRSSATTNSLRPVKRYFASATAARNASDDREHDRDADDDQAVLDRVPEARVQRRRSRRGSAASVGLRREPGRREEMISASGLNAVEIIQKTGKDDHDEDGEPDDVPRRTPDPARGAPAGGDGSARG